MQTSERFPLNFFSLIAGGTLIALLSSCASSGDTKINDSGIQVRGASVTPPHRMSKYEYPFDANGTYIAAWALEGERRAGRSTSMSSSGSRKQHYNSAPSAPSSSSSSVYHTVGSRDTLWGISRKYGTSVSAIKSLNGLRSDTIQTGARLRIR